MSRSKVIVYGIFLRVLQYGSLCNVERHAIQGGGGGGGGGRRRRITYNFM